MAWGNGVSAKRGAWVAGATGAQLLCIEDAFLRSVLPGRSGQEPLGLLIDPQACHFDASRPSALEDLLKTHPLDSPELLERSCAALARIDKHKLTKYSGVPLRAACPDAGFVLVIDQTRGDASIERGAANAQSFQDMLAQARAEHPTARIVIKTHPETQLGYRSGHFSTEGLDDGMELLTHAIGPKISLLRPGPSTRSPLNWDLKPFGLGIGQWYLGNRFTPDGASAGTCSQSNAVAAPSRQSNYSPRP